MSDKCGDFSGVAVIFSGFSFARTKAFYLFVLFAVSGAFLWLVVAMFWHLGSLDISQVYPNRESNDSLVCSIHGTIMYPRIVEATHRTHHSGWFDQARVDDFREMPRVLKRSWDEYQVAERALFINFWHGRQQKWSELNWYCDSCSEDRSRWIDHNISPVWITIRAKDRGRLGSSTRLTMVFDASPKYLGNDWIMADFELFWSTVLLGSSLGSEVNQTQLERMLESIGRLDIDNREIRLSIEGELSSDEWNDAENLICKHILSDSTLARISHVNYDDLYVKGYVFDCFDALPE